MLGNRQNFVKVRVKKVLFAGEFHRQRQKAAAAGNDAGQPLSRERHMRLQQARMNRHVIDALRSLIFHRLPKNFPIQSFGTARSLKCLIDRYCAERYGRTPQKRFARLHNALARRQIHHGIGTAKERLSELADLFMPILAGARSTDIGIHLRREGLADGHRLGFWMIEVERNHRFSPGHQRTNIFRRPEGRLSSTLIKRPGFGISELGERLQKYFAIEVLSFSHKRHFRRDNARASTLVLGGCARRRAIAQTRLLAAVAFAKGTSHIAEVNRGLHAAAKRSGRRIQINPTERNQFAAGGSAVFAHARKAPCEKTKITGSTGQILRRKNGRYWSPGRRVS